MGNSRSLQDCVTPRVGLQHLSSTRKYIKVRPVHPLKYTAVVVPMTVWYPQNNRSSEPTHMLQRCTQVSRSRATTWMERWGKRFLKVAHYTLWQYKRLWRHERPMPLDFAGIRHKAPWQMLGRPWVESGRLPFGDEGWPVWAWVLLGVHGRFRFDQW